MALKSSTVVAHDNPLLGGIDDALEPVESVFPIQGVQVKLHRAVGLVRRYYFELTRRLRYRAGGGLHGTPPV